MKQLPLIKEEKSMSEGEREAAEYLRHLIKLAKQAAEIGTDEAYSERLSQAAMVYALNIGSLREQNARLREEVQGWRGACRAIMPRLTKEREAEIRATAKEALKSALGELSAALLELLDELDAARAEKTNIWQDYLHANWDRARLMNEVMYLRSRFSSHGE